MQRAVNSSNLAKGFGIGMMVLLFFVGACGMGSIVENVDSDEIVVIQDAVDGEIHFYTQAGVVAQWFGKVTSYPKRSIYEFEAPVQFNDGGKGIIHGSIQYELPLDETNLRELYTRYRSADAIQKQVMETVTNKVIYMTGPVMSSRESYAEKRNYLINYVQDQIDNGVYQTRQAQKEETDQFSGQKKVVTVAEIVSGPDGRPVRQENSVVSEFGIRAFNFAIEQIDYDDVVEKQIQQQQQITMDVQTSVAEALKAQQYAITVEQQGKANAANAKWEQEVLKAKAVTEAQQRLEVQQLDQKTAEAYKTATLLRAEADAQARQKMMQADGALDKKLATYEKVQQAYAQALANMKVPIVPSTVFGGGAGASSSGVQNYIDLQTMKAAKDLGLDPTPGKQ